MSLPVHRPPNPAVEEPAMEFTVRITAETSIESLEDTIAMCTALLRCKRQRLQGPTMRRRKTKKVGAEAASFTPVPVPEAPTAPATQSSGQPDNRTALPAPVPLIPQPVPALPPVFTPIPFRPDVTEPQQSPTEGTPQWPTDPVRTSSGQWALPAPVPVRAPGAPSANTFIPVTLAANQVSSPAPRVATTNEEVNQ